MLACFKESELSFEFEYFHDEEKNWSKRKTKPQDIKSSSFSELCFQ